MLLLSGDIQVNPGPKSKTVKPTKPQSTHVDHAVKMSTQTTKQWNAKNANHGSILNA